MGEGEILEVEQTRSLAAPFVFFIVFAFQFATKRLQDLKRGASKTYKEMQLRGEIKQLLKEAASYSQPSTFAQAAKLRRMAAAKEKELANYQAHLTQEGGCYPGRFGVFRATMSGLGSYPGWYCVLGLASLLVDLSE